MLVNIREVFGCGILFALVSTALSFDLDHLDNILQTNPSEFCDATECVDPTNPDNCPSGTRYTEGTSVSGCCGACVRYMQEYETGCTGMLDPHECSSKDGTVFIGPGYGMCDDNSLPLPHQQVTKTLLRADQTEDTLNSYWCDLGLACIEGSNGTANYCKVVSEWMTCQNVQDALDRDWNMEWYVGYRDDYRWRPNCEADGSYSPKQCKGSPGETTQACMCVDSSGEYINGKAFIFEGRKYKDMNCLCSRKIHELRMAGVSTTLHCSSNGNYEPIQCNNGWCRCIHPENGTFYGSLMIENAMNLLPCFNSSTVGSMYLRQCDSQVYLHEHHMAYMADKGANGFPAYPARCNDDGSYLPKQCKGGTCTCVNKYGTTCVIDGSQGCECYRDKLVYEEFNQSYALVSCTTTKGSYNMTQVWPDHGVAYGVDQEGIRVTPLSRENCVTRYIGDPIRQCIQFGNNRNYSDTDYCEQVCEGCPTQAFYYSPDFTVNDDCYGLLM